MQMNSGNEAAQGVVNQPVIVDIRNMTAEQLGQLGMSQIAYVKPVIVNGSVGYAIHAANGLPMGLAEDRDVAIAAVIQHEMMPVPVH